MSHRRAVLSPTLVVEDDPVLRKAVCGALEDAGLHPIECVDLTSARAAIDRLKPVVVVLDLSLGGEFGADLLTELAAMDDPPSVVICSAFGLANLVAARFSVPYVQKPFDLDHLIAEVSRAIERRARPRLAQSG